MTYKEAYRLERRWQRKASLISLFHHKMCLKNSKWKMRNTAKYFDISLGKVSEDIKIILNIDRVIHCRSRHDALIMLK